MRNRILLAGSVAALGLGLYAMQGGPGIVYVWTLIGGNLAATQFDGSVVNGVLKANVPAPIPGPVGPPGAQGPAGPIGPELAGQPCLAPGGTPALMVKLPNNTCLPIVAVYPSTAVNGPTIDLPLPAVVDPPNLTWAGPVNTVYRLTALKEPR
jgi:hypothetical protein